VFRRMYGEAVGRAGSIHTISFVGGQLQAASINKGDIVVKIGKLFLALCLLTVSGGLVANAQVMSVPQIEAEVPFDFVVGDTMLPAGKYQITTVDGGANDNILEIRSANSRTAVIFDTEDAENRGELVKNKTQLVFNKVGDEHFLFQIWVAGSASGNELAKSRMEKRLVKAGNQSHQQLVVASVKKLKP